MDGEARITWGITIYTDKELKHNRPDITVMHKNTFALKWTLINIAVLADLRNEKEKIGKYQDLAFEIKRIHGALKVTMIPIVIGQSEPSLRK